MASMDDYLRQLSQQNPYGGLGQALSGFGQIGVAPHPQTAAPMPPPEPEFNLVLLTGEDDEA